MNAIKKERNFLNTFTLEAIEYNKNLKNILLLEEDMDLESIENKLLNINLAKN